MPATVHIVHCIDTEGPLHESLEATFERLDSIFGLKLSPDIELLRRLQTRQVDLGGIEAAVSRVLDPHLLDYNDTWDKVDRMLAEALSEEFRNEVRDSYGGGWVYNWFCVDHVDYDSNPRQRDIGYHCVFDHYCKLLAETGSVQDGLHFHYHPHSFRKEAHLCATHWWANSDSLGQILSRRVIDRNWFPAANRPGYHVIRPDSHWFLEQFVPFDFSNQAATEDASDRSQLGLETGRFGDWRRAPANWRPYHPSHDDYQRPGDCRRWISRCLNVGTRYRLLREVDLRQAFQEAQDGKPVILGLTNHDFRDLRLDVRLFRQMLQTVSEEFPEVKFRFSGAVEAMRSALQLNPQAPCDLDLTLTKSDGTAHFLEVTSSTPTFGCQPWLALKTVAGTYHFDNFDIATPFHRWSYIFDEETFPLTSLEAIGVAGNNAYGIATVNVLNVSNRQVARELWHAARMDDTLSESQPAYQMK